MSAPLIPMASVAIEGGWFGDDTFPRARIVMNGSPVSAILYALVGSDFHYVDRLSGGEIAEDPSGTIVLTGQSDELLNVVGVKPDAAKVTWRIKPLGCASCR